MPWLSLGFAQFSIPPITFLMVRPSVHRVKSRLLSPLPEWSHVLLNRHSMAPVYRHLLNATPSPRGGLRVVKSALNPGFGRVKPPLCPEARGPRVSIDWCIKGFLWGESLKAKWLIHYLILFKLDKKYQVFYYIQGLSWLSILSAQTISSNSPSNVKDQHSLTTMQDLPEETFTIGNELIAV